MKKHSMLSEIWRRFRKNHHAVVGLAVLAAVVLYQRSMTKKGPATA